MSVLRSGVRVMATLVVALLVAAAGPPPSSKPSEAVPLTTEQEERYRDIIWKLRCLVCQNESIAESNAPLANDLRRIVREQLAEGRTDREIKQYMRDRYGDFVLYQPPLNATTAILWGAPGLLLVIGLIVLVRRMRSGYVEDDADEPESFDAADDGDASR